MHISDKPSSIVLTVILAVIISFLIYVLIVELFLDKYIVNNKRELSILSFYPENRDNNSSIYFIGNSQVMEGIDCNIIENYLNTNYSNHIFNLALSGDCPLRRVTELESIIRYKPMMVVIGLSYCSLNDSSIPDDYLALVGSRVELDDYSMTDLFNKNQLKLLNQNIIEHYLYKRKFLLSSIDYLFLFDRSRVAPNNFKDPHRYTKDISYDALVELIKRKQTYDSWRYVSTDENVQKKSLKHIISKLKSKDVKIILINMPLNPILSDTIPNRSRINYYNTLNGSSANYYDFERSLNYTDFIDGVHMNSKGREKFSKNIADLLQKTKGV